MRGGLLLMLFIIVGSIPLNKQSAIKALISRKPVAELVHPGSPANVGSSEKIKDHYHFGVAFNFLWQQDPATTTVDDGCTQVHFQTTQLYHVEIMS